MMTMSDEGDGDGDQEDADQAVLTKMRAVKYVGEVIVTKKNLNPTLSDESFPKLKNTSTAKTSIGMEAHISLKEGGRPQKDTPGKATDPCTSAPMLSVDRLKKRR